MRFRKIAIAVVVTVVTSGALAQKTSTVGIPTADFNFASAAQLRSEWCWAASVQMILNWYNIPIQQKQVVGRIYGKPIDEAASEDSITVALSGATYDRNHHRVNLQAERYRGIPRTDLLVGELSQRHPILITFHSTHSMLHAVVLTSAEYERKQDGRVHVTALTFRDPNPSIKGRKPAGAIRVTGSELGRFVRSISSYYVVKVKTA